MNTQSDPRAPFVYGIIGLGVVLLGGIVWAVASAPSESGSRGRTDVNVSFRDENDPTLGPADAKVALRMFEDFQCPACKAAEPGVKYAIQKYGDRVKVIWNDFPLSSHRNAMPAANAARCAEEQGKFWEIKEALYESQSNWSDKPDPADEFRALAKKISLNEETFSDCLADKKYNSKITSDYQEGNANGVDATPTFFLNQRKIVGVLSQDEWDREFTAALGRD